MSDQITETVEACRDPKDDRILKLAVNGDDDLLVLHPFRGIQVVTPTKLVEVLDDSEPEEGET